MKIYLIRHGKTKGNLEKRYVGATDEPLCLEGYEDLKEFSEKDLPQEDHGKKSLPKERFPQMVYVSPMVRCRQSGEILFPKVPQRVVSDFRECDFGQFEYKNYPELKDCPEYQDWLRSRGTLPFPRGEGRRGFQERCVKAFCKVLEEAEENGWGTIACVVHGGTIMSILEALALPKRDYYDYQVSNGCGYLVQWDIEHMVDFSLSLCYPVSYSKTKHG